MDKQKQDIPSRRELGWGTMLAFIALALLVAGAIAYRLVAPFFHHP